MDYLILKIAFKFFIYHKTNKIITYGFVLLIVYYKWNINYFKLYVRHVQDTSSLDICICLCSVYLKPILTSISHRECNK